MCVQQELVVGNSWFRKIMPINTRGKNGGRKGALLDYMLLPKRRWLRAIEK